MSAEITTKVVQEENIKCEEIVSKEEFVKNEENVSREEFLKNEEFTEIKQETTTKPLKAEEITDGFHYLKSGEYTSEMFKIVVHNIPKKISYGRLRDTFFKILGFRPHKTNYNKSREYAYLNFRNEEEREKALGKLDKFKFKDRILHAKIAAPVQDPYIVKGKKRKAHQNADDASSKKQKTDDRPAEDRICDVVCSFSSLSYETQLDKKQEEMEYVLKRFTARLRQEKTLYSKWLADDRTLCVELDRIHPSPVQNAYRNKVEFTVGKGPDFIDNCVGFRLGSYKDGDLTTVPPTKCINCPPSTIAVAKELQEFLRTLPHTSFCLSTHNGLWQSVMVRTCTTDDIMVVLQVNRAYFQNQADLDHLKGELRKHFTGEFRTVKVTSLYISYPDKQSRKPSIEYSLVYGSQHIVESLLGLNFRISPEAFFQINTPAAEELYKIVIEWCDPDNKDTLVLDLCCGTGTIGLCIAKRTNIPVVGIELNQQAVQDANYNAQQNGVSNARFVCGAVEKVLHGELRNIQQKNIIAVIDPPRAGLLKETLHCLRNCKAIQKMIYISCSPKQAIENFVALCRTENKHRSGKPFRPVRAKPVDLFPQTPHCELVMQLERIQNYDDCSTASTKEACTLTAVRKVDEKLLENTTDGASTEIKDAATPED